MSFVEVYIGKDYRVEICFHNPANDWQVYNLILDENETNKHVNRFNSIWFSCTGLVVIVIQASFLQVNKKFYLSVSLPEAERGSNVRTYVIRKSDAYTLQVNLG